VAEKDCRECEPRDGAGETTCEGRPALGPAAEDVALDVGRMAIVAMADGLVIYTPDGKIGHINPAAERLLGLSSDDAGASIDERGLRVLAIDGKPIAPEQQPIAHALRGETVPHQVVLLEGPPPHGRRPVSVSAVPMREANGQLAGVVATFTDATALQQAREQRDEVVRMVSHDLRTPLSVLLMQAQMLQRSVPPGDRNAKRVDTIIANGQRLATMIRDLVEMARLENGQFQLVRKTIDVQPFITGVVDRLAVTQPTDRIRLSFADGLPSLSADPDRLERILVHLLSNALKYSQAPAEVLLHASWANGLVSIAVTDHGVGISRQNLPHLFQHGSQSDSASRRESLGLGLSITDLLVRAHGGRIEVESELGKGSVFRVHLPT